MDAWTSGCPFSRRTVGSCGTWTSGFPGNKQEWPVFCHGLGTGPFLSSPGTGVTGAEMSLPDLLWPPSPWSVRTAAHALCCDQGPREGGW